MKVKTDDTSPAPLPPNAQGTAMEVSRLESESPTHPSVIPGKPAADGKLKARLLCALNQLLADELIAICQYMVHAEMCDNWGYDRLHQAIGVIAREEMHHAEWLIRRILFLEGIPVFSSLSPICIGRSVAEMVGRDQEAEHAAVLAYNAAISLARESSDQSTVELLTKILKMEEGHMEWAGMQRSQIEQMGQQNYLTTQTSGAQGSAADSTPG